MGLTWAADRSYVVSSHTQVWHMRTFRSVVAIVSTALLMACQTATSVGMNRQAPAAATSVNPSQLTSPASSAVSYSERHAPAPVAESTGKRRTWIIVGLVVAIAIVAVILVSGGSDGGGIY
jgi:hypothetical protein